MESKRKFDDQDGNDNNSQPTKKSKNDSTNDPIYNRQLESKSYKIIINIKGMSFNMLLKDTVVINATEYNTFAYLFKQIQLKTPIYSLGALIFRHNDNDYYPRYLLNNNIKGILLNSADSSGVITIEADIDTGKQAVSSLDGYQMEQFDSLELLCVNSIFNYLRSGQIQDGQVTQHLSEDIKQAYFYPKKKD